MTFLSSNPTRKDPTMTPFMTAEEREAADDFLAAQFQSAVEAADTCSVHGHAWLPDAYGRLACTRCSITPHTPTKES